MTTGWNNLAHLYALQGRYSEAEPLYLEPLEMQKRHPGEKHSTVAAALKDLVELYRSRGHYSEAEPLHIE